MDLEMLPLDSKHFMVVGLFNCSVGFYLLFKNQNRTFKVHKYLILQRKVWLSRCGARPIHDLKHFMATLPCKSHRWQKPSCILKCFVTCLTPESNFSCKRLSQRYVPTNRYRSGPNSWHCCLSPALLPPWKSGVRGGNWVSGGPCDPAQDAGRTESVFWSRHQSQRVPCPLTLHRRPPRAVPDASSHFEWTHRGRATQPTKQRWARTPAALSETEVPMCPHFCQRSR